MTWDQVEGKWNQMKGSAKQQFAKLSDDDILYIAGRRDSLIGKLQERYGIAREEAQRRADEWIKTAKETGAPAPQHAERGGGLHAGKH